MKTSVTFEGGKDLVAALQALSPRQYRKDSLDSLKAAAAPLISVASAIAPRGDGPGPHMADNLGTMTASSREIAVAVGPERRPEYIFWAYFWELGTVRFGARPFLRPAFDQTIGRMLAVLKTYLWFHIKKRAARAQREGKS